MSDRTERTLTILMLLLISILITEVINVIFSVQIGLGFLIGLYSCLVLNNYGLFIVETKKPIKKKTTVPMGFQ